MEVLLNLISTMKRTDKDYLEIFQTIIQVRDNYWYHVKDYELKSKVILDEQFKKLKSTSKYKAICVGHAHLDLAWLWPIRESKRKAVRTLTNVIYLLENYDDFTFVISQPQQIIWIKNNAFDLYYYIGLGILFGKAYYLD